MTQKTKSEESPVVSSVKSDAKREFEELIRSDDRFTFEASEMAGSPSGNPELWSLWYDQLLSDFFTGTEKLFNAPLGRTDETVEDGLNSFVDGFNLLSDKGSERIDGDTTPLIKNRNKIQDFMDKESESVTVIIQIHGGQCNLECINGFIDNQVINFRTDSEDIDCVDESSLIEHSSEVMEFMNGYSPYRRRPHEKYKRTLCVSIKRVDQGFNVTVGVDEVRTRGYSIWEKILSPLGEDFSSESYTEFLNS